MAEKHIGSLPVVDANGRLVGLLTMQSLLMSVMPDFVHLMEEFNFVADFGAAEERKPDQALRSRRGGEIILAPEAVEETSGLIRAFALLFQHQLHDLPVVDVKGKLVGIISAYAAGFATGTFVDMKIEERLALDMLVLRIILPNGGDEMAQSLRSAGYGVTIVNGEGAADSVKSLYTVIKRRDMEEVAKIIHINNPKEFFSVEEVRLAESGVFPMEAQMADRKGK